MSGFMSGRVFRRVFVAVGAVALAGAAVVALLVTGAVPEAWRPILLRPLRPSVGSIQARANVVGASLAGLDLRSHASLIPTLRFNLNTRWPPAERMPPGVDPGTLLTNAMDPGLGVRELHRQGITGAGVGVAIIDFRIFPDHPEFRGRLAALQDLSGQTQGSMHGPAVASLLVGARCGTAPGASLYYVALPDPGDGVESFIRALDWLLATNRHLPAPRRIRVVSISASPDETPPEAEAWAAARERAEKEGLMVLDVSRGRPFVGPCELDPVAPDHPARARPVPARDRPGFFRDHLLVPVAPRTTAEQYYPGHFGYQYCGTGAETFLYHGVSWAVPYCAGVLAMGWQIRPDLSPDQMRALLFSSAHVLPTGERIIDPPAFIARVRESDASPAPPESR